VVQVVVSNERTRRVGSNEAVFRELNAQLAGLREASELSCVCECGELSCVESIVMTFDEYRQVRADDTTFAIHHGHAMDDVEDVIASNDRYQVVRKKPGLPAAVARASA